MPTQKPKPTAPLTLTKLDDMPDPVAMPPVALADMTLPELGEAFTRLTIVEEGCERLSGIVATLKGLMLMEAKAKLPHGEYLPWLQKHFGKTRKTAAQYVRLARGFSEMSPEVTFEILHRDLSISVQDLEANKLDLSHPIVAQIAEWTDGKSSTQLMLDLGPARLGGKPTNATA